jgi:hypothetical protein
MFAPLGEFALFSAQNEYEHVSFAPVDCQATINEQ